MDTPAMSFCYLLYSEGGKRTYIGATIDVDRRLQQHNRLLSGGARATAGRQWTRAVYVAGFPDWQAALQFEWSWKFHTRRMHGLEKKLIGLLDVLQLRQSTSNAMPFVMWPQHPRIIPTPLLDSFEKFECYPKLQAYIMQPMDSISTTDIAKLMHTIEEMKFEIEELRRRLDAALSETPAVTRVKRASHAGLHPAQPVA